MITDFSKYKSINESKYFIDNYELLNYSASYNIELPKFKIGDDVKYINILPVIINNKIELNMNLEQIEYAKNHMNKIHTINEKFFGISWWSKLSNSDDSWVQDKFLKSASPTYTPRKFIKESIKDDKEKELKKDETKYLSKKERDRLSDSQRKYLINKRKESGSWNDDDLQQESLRDKMVGKSDDDILKSLDGMDILTRINRIEDYELPSKYLPTQKEIIEFFTIKDEHIINEKSYADTNFQKPLEELIKILGSKYGDIKMYDSENDDKYYERIYNILKDYVKNDKSEYVTYPSVQGEYDFLVYKDKQVAFLLADMGEPNAILFDINLGRKNNKNDYEKD